MNQKSNIRTTGRELKLGGFSLIELLTAMSILSILLAILLGAVSSVSSIYVRTGQQVQSKERGRSILELIARELTPAVVDTRMQFVILPGSELTEAGALDVASSSPAAVWMAPLGRGGKLRCVGYYLTRNIDRKHFRLKRMYIRDDNENGYFPSLGNSVDARSLQMRTSAVNADWFTAEWEEQAFDDISSDNDDVVVSTLSGGVVGFWINAIDSLGNPVPLMSQSQNHPESDLIFNSAGYFYFAETSPFDSGETFVYLSKDKLTMKANKLPAELDIAVLMLSDDVLNNHAEQIPDMTNIYHESGALDMTKSIEALQAELEAIGLRESNVFRTKVKLTNGG